MCSLQARASSACMGMAHLTGRLRYPRKSLTQVRNELQRPRQGNQCVSDLATRNPMKSKRVNEKFRLRAAERSAHGLLNQEPPR